jgi:hypothetical protein
LAYWEKGHYRKVIELKKPAGPVTVSLSPRERALSSSNRGLSPMRPEEVTKYMLFGEKPKPKTRAKRGWSYILQSLVNKDSQNLFDLPP